MELRVLRYFLTVAHTGNITRAADLLHITQPTLSRQIRSLEDELGQRLLIRNSHSVSLTTEGILLCKRAEEIFDLVETTEKEVSQAQHIPAGDVYIGAGETVGVRLLLQAAHCLQNQSPHIHFHILSGDGDDVCQRLDQGLIDFGLVFDPIDTTKYNAVPLRHQDIWGVLMPRNSPLATKQRITREDLIDKPLILSRRTTETSPLGQWLAMPFSQLAIAATYNLAFNGSLMVESGMGYCLCLDHIINVSGSSHLDFRQLEPALAARTHIIWKKYHAFSAAAAAYLEKLLAIISN